MIAWWLSVAFLFIFCLVCVYLLGQVIGCQAVAWETACRHDAIVCALVAEERVDPAGVRICIGRTPLGTMHAQAGAIVDGEWQWLHHWDGMVCDCAQDEFKPDRCVPKEEVIRTYFK